MALTLTGPRCRDCRRTEQECAYTYPCCSGCGHFRHLDARGNERRPDPADSLTAARRAYWRHRYNKRKAS